MRQCHAPKCRLFVGEGVIRAIIKNYKLCPINWHLIVEIYTEFDSVWQESAATCTQNYKLLPPGQVGPPELKSWDPPATKIGSRKYTSIFI